MQLSISALLLLFMNAHWYFLGKIYYNKSSYDCGQHTRQPIDKSTTFFEFHDITEKCSMVDFAVKHYPNYQPTDGYGYYKYYLTDEEYELDPSLSVILMVRYQ